MPFCSNKWFSYTRRILLTSFSMKSYLIVYVALQPCELPVFWNTWRILYFCWLWTYHLPCVILMNCIYPYYPYEPMKTKVHKISKFFIRKSAFLFLAKFYGHFSKCYNEVSYLLRHRCCRLWNYHQQNIGTRRFHRWRTNSSLGMGEDRTLDRRNWSSLIS